MHLETLDLESVLWLPGTWISAFYASASLLFRLQEAASRNSCLGLVLASDLGSLARALLWAGTGLSFSACEYLEQRGQEKMKGTLELCVKTAQPGDGGARGDN